MLQNMDSVLSLLHDCMCAVCFEVSCKCKQMCPEMRVNKMHALYDKRHKVSPFL